MRLLLISKLILLIIIAGACNQKDEKLYLDSAQPVEKRVDDLMNRMTLEEKVGQMCQYVGFEHIKQSKSRLQGDELVVNDQWGMYPGESMEDLKKRLIKGEIGSFLHVKSLEEANKLQEIALESRLQIPVIFGIDAIHGHAFFEGATVFPTQIGLASSWNDSLLKEIGEITASEMRVTGMHWTFSPNVELSRDARWGRTGETFGEDPLLVSRLGAALTRGYQGDLKGTDDVLACAKHYAAGGEPVNGVNAAPMSVSESDMRNLWLAPFQKQVEAGAYTFMAAHHELNGIPCHGNKQILTDILRDEWGFDGFVVSDWMDIERLNTLHHVVSNQKEAVELAVNAGMDMNMHGPDFHAPLVELVKEGRVSEERVNQSCRKILKAKFQLGLFEHPFAEKKKADQVLFSDQHKQKALQAAREGIVLLKNENDFLPLSGHEKILVTGPNANNQRILGDWSYAQPENKVVNVYEGVQQVFDQVDYINSGESLKNPDEKQMNRAIRQAGGYDAVIVVIGSNSLRYQRKEKTSGENVDRAEIDLVGKQLELLKRIYERNPNTIVVMVNSRPLSEPWMAEHIPAILEAWEPGSMGGLAVAEILAGKVNPSGKLPITIPYNVGQTILTYNHKPSHYFHDYLGTPEKPLWHFDEGLSYTDYQYQQMDVSHDSVSRKGQTKVTVKISNTGKRYGEEIVQLYIRDKVSSITRPVKELIDYKRVPLSAGESREVAFTLHADQLGAYYKDTYEIEPGTFQIMAGASSKDKDLLLKEIKVY